VSGLQPVRSRSLLRRRPDAATWPIARDVSQRAEPDVRPLGRAASAFIAEKMCRLSITLTDDVPPQHLMCPVHTAGRRRPGHPAGGVPVQSIVKQYARAVRCTVFIITYALPGKLPLHANTMQITGVRAQEDCSSNSKYYIRYVHRPTCRGSVPLYAPPLAIKGEACNVTKKRALSSTLRHSQVHTSSIHHTVE
jgi:hypothetical protein